MKVKRNDFVRCNLGNIIVNKVANHLLETGELLNVTDIEKGLANYCEVHLQSIRLIKNGTTSCSLPVALKISKFLGVKVEDLFYVEG